MHLYIRLYMVKLTFLAVAFTILVAFASARKTVVVTTTIEDDDPSSQKQQQYCSPKLQQESFDQCQIYLLQQANDQDYHEGQQQGQDFQQQCCSELQKVDDQCQCVAVKQVLRDFLQTQQQQQIEQGGGLFGFQQIERFKQKAQNLPNQCNPQTRQQECEIGTISTTTIITEDPYINPIIPTRGGSQQCSQRIPQRFNQCERFIQQALQSCFPRILMSINKQGRQEQQQQLQKLQQKCCNELENVQEECHCEALQKVYRQAIQQPPPPPQWQQHGSQQGGQIQEVQQVVQVLKNQCNLKQVQQCRIPSAMF